MKPDGSGGFKVAGAHPETYLLENENGARAVIDTHTLSCTSWKTASGKELMKGKDSIIQCFPDASTPVKGGFIPEERAKKLSFDRMIFKLNPEGLPDIEYRVDVTMREDSLEYDVIVMNAGKSTLDVTCGIKFDMDPSAKITKVTGYTTTTDKSVSTGKWTVPVGKFKETKFYVKIDAPK
jgi:peroxiredoxin